MSFLIRQKLVKNAKMENFECDIFCDFQTLCTFLNKEKIVPKAMKHWPFRSYNLCWSSKGYFASKAKSASRMAKACSPRSFHTADRFAKAKAKSFLPSSSSRSSSSGDDEGANSMLCKKIRPSLAILKNCPFFVALPVLPTKSLRGFLAQKNPLNITKLSSWFVFSYFHGVSNFQKKSQFFTKSQVTLYFHVKIKRIFSLNKCK